MSCVSLYPPVANQRFKLPIIMSNRNPVFVLVAYLVLFVFAEVGMAESDVSVLLDEGDRLLASGDLEAAYNRYHRASDADEKSVSARLKLAGVQLIRREYRHSIDTFQAVIGMDRTNAKAFVGMGIAYLHLGNYGLARASFEEAVKNDPSKQQDVQQVLNWLASKTGSNPGISHQ